MTAKKAYEKPVVESNQVFSLTSTQCDVLYTIPDPCGPGVMWGDACEFQRKSPNSVTCTQPLLKPIFKS